MNYGLYLSAAGALSSMYRQDVLANNLANMNTTAFKPDRVTARERLPERLEGSVLTADPQWLLERLGGGLFMDPTRVDLTPGALAASASELDFGIQGEGLFVVNDGRTVGPQSHRLTRDGRFTLSPQGELVTVAGGHRVLDRGLRPIQLDTTASVKVNGNGDVIQSGAIVTRLALREAPDASTLEKLGDNLFRLRDGGAVSDLATATGSIRQHFTEASAVDPIQTMTALLAAAKSAQTNLKMMQYHDQALGQAINTFGRVA